MSKNKLLKAYYSISQKSSRSTSWNAVQRWELITFYRMSRLSESVTDCTRACIRLRLHLLYVCMSSSWKMFIYQKWPGNPFSFHVAFFVACLMGNVSRCREEWFLKSTLQCAQSGFAPCVLYCMLPLCEKGQVKKGTKITAANQRACWSFESLPKAFDAVTS